MQTVSLSSRGSDGPAGASEWDECSIYAMNIVRNLDIAEDGHPVGGSQQIKRVLKQLTNHTHFFAIP